MRTREQDAKRYFGAVWLTLLFIITVFSVFVATAESPTPDWVVISALLITAVGSAILGFVHGITIFVARQKDVELVEYLEAGE